MLKLNSPTADTLQKQVLILPNGKTTTLILCFKPLQYGWFIQSLTYQDFSLAGFRVFTSPNTLQQFKNLLPFGLACFTTDGNEPKLQKDFSSGYATLYLLTEAEVAQYSSLLNE